MTVLQAVCSAEVLFFYGNYGRNAFTEWTAVIWRTFTGILAEKVFRIIV